MLNKSKMNEAQKAKYEQILGLDLKYAEDEVTKDLTPTLGKDAAEAEAKADVDCYHDFLFITWYLLAQPRTKAAAPCVCADRIWHEHILVTPQYRADCNTVFGKYLDHVPSDYAKYAIVTVTASDRQVVNDAYAQFDGHCNEQRDECIWCGTP